MGKQIQDHLYTQISLVGRNMEGVDKSFQVRGRRIGGIELGEGGSKKEDMLVHEILSLHKFRQGLSIIQMEGNSNYLNNNY